MILLIVTLIGTLIILLAVKPGLSYLLSIPDKKIKDELEQKQKSGRYTMRISITEYFGLLIMNRKLSEVA